MKNQYHQQQDQNGPPPPYEAMLRDAGAPDKAVQIPNMDIPTAEKLDQEGLAFSYHPASSGQQGKVMNHNQESYYKVRYRDKGIFCNDPLVNNDREALINFLINNCSQPKLFVQIHGYRCETRYRIRTNADDSTSIASYRECVTDFYDSYNVSALVQPTGFIYATSDKHGHFSTVDQLAAQYVANTNKFKSIKLLKHPDWDYGQLKQAIRDAIRMMGYRHHISVTFTMENHQMSVQSDSKTGKASKTPLIRALCCCLWNRKEKIDPYCLRADFQMAMTAQQWFIQNYWIIIANVRGGALTSQISSKAANFH